jgi:hypothetical protein
MPQIIRPLLNPCYPHMITFAVPDFRGDASCAEKVATCGLHEHTSKGTTGVCGEI